MQPAKQLPVKPRQTRFPLDERLFKLVLPAALLALPILGLFWLNEIGAVLVAVTALLVGAFFRQARLWVVWLQTVVLWWIAGGVYTLIGDSSGNGDETVLTFMIEAFPFTVMLILLPLFLGRVIGNLVFDTDD